MKKPISILIITLLGAMCLISVITYVSILGENHKIDRIIITYFDDLKKGMYLEACQSFSSSLQYEELSSAEQRVNFNFLLELSLLKYYNLIDQYDYKVEVQRSNFWIPYISEDVVSVSVFIKKGDSQNFVKRLAGGKSKNFTHNLIVVGREKGMWRIKHFNINNTSISSIYNDLSNNIKLDKYVKKATDGFLLQDAEINPKNLTPIEKRLLRFSLYKIRYLLDAPSQ